MMADRATHAVDGRAPRRPGADVASEPARSARVSTLVACAWAVLAGAAAAQSGGPVFSELTEIAAPVAAGAREPSLQATADGRLLMSWIEPSERGFAVRTSIRGPDGWSDPASVIEADDLFVNYADFPSAIALPDGSLAAHWLRKNSDASYAYDVNIAISDDDGRDWGPTLVPHRDATQRQHGFATLLPVERGTLLAIWLDGRNYDTTDTFAGGETSADAMQLRAAAIGSDGTMSEETLLDARTCTCCQTSAVITGDGTVVVAYRDRTEDETRDISVLRRVDGVWSEPASVNDDGWRIAGCPVNGPALDAAGENLALAWFTAAGNVPAVNVAFSDDAGRTFGQATRIDQGTPAGRVDVLHLGDGSALVSWLEYTALGEALMVCRAVPDEGCGRPTVIAISRTGRTMGFPRMARTADGVHIAWTAPTGDSPDDPDRATTIRMVLAQPGDQG